MTHSPRPWTVRQLFSAALSQPAAERLAFVHREAGADANLADRVVSLLSAHEREGQSERWSAILAGVIQRDLGAAARMPEHIGEYRVIGALGEGGAGRVYKCDRPLGLGTQSVAVKLLHLRSRARKADLEREVNALLRMKHSGIATILSAGEDAEGRSYLAMEYVEGKHITKHCEEERVSLRGRLELVQELCEAVAHAHQKRVVHRDLKPANVLVSRPGSGVSVKVVDFGLSSTSEGGGVDGGDSTGTPNYIAPEQAAGEDVDTRADVYSIGAILSELLCGKPMYDLEEMKRIFPTTSVAYMRAWSEHVRAHPAALPSERLASDGAALEAVAAGMGVRRGSLLRLLREDLDWVVRKATAVTPDQRYKSPLALKADLQRYLALETVGARPIDLGYRARKFVVRHRLQVAATGLVAIAALVAGWYAVRNGELLAIAREETAAAEAVTAFVQDALVRADPYEGGNQGLSVLEAMDKAIEGLESGTSQLEPATKARLLRTIASILNGSARSKQALQLAEQALAIEQELHATDHPNLAASITAIAHCLQSLSRPQDALPMFESALAMRQRMFPGNHEDVAESLNAVAKCLESLSRIDEALPLFQAALAMRQKLFPRDHRDVAQSLNNVGFCLNSMDRKAEALVMYEAALAMTQRLYEGDHPDLASRLHNVGLCMVDLGKDLQVPQAQPILEASLAMRIRLFQGDHPAIAQSLNAIGYCLSARGREDEARTRYETALAMLQRVYPGDHEVVVVSLGNLGQCLSKLNLHEEALSKSQTALAMVQRLHLGDQDHASVARCLNNAAACLSNLGRHEEALGQYREALKMFDRIHTGDHSNKVYAQNNVADCLGKLGRVDEARSNFEEALSMAQRLHPNDHHSVAMCLTNLGVLLAQTNKPMEALPKLEVAVAMWQRLHPEGDSVVADGMINLAVCLRSLGRHVEALPRLEAAVAIWRRLSPGDSEQLLLALSGLGNGLCRCDRELEALPHLQEALAMHRRLRPGDDLEVAVSLNNLANCLGALGRAEDALPYYEEALAMRQGLTAGEDADLAVSMRRLASCLLALDRAREALPHAERAEAMARRITPEGDPLREQTAKLLEKVRAKVSEGGK